VATGLGLNLPWTLEQRALQQLAKHADDGLHFPVALHKTGIEPGPAKHHQQRLDQRIGIDRGSELPLLDCVIDDPGEKFPTKPYRVIFGLVLFRMALGFQNGGHQKCRGRGVLGIDCHRRRDEPGEPRHQGSLAVRLRNTGAE
jgi:hypothetical protein